MSGAEPARVRVVEPPRPVEAEPAAIEQAPRSAPAFARTRAYELVGGAVLPGAPPAPPSPPPASGNGLNRSFAGLRTVVNITDSDPARAEATQQLLALLASQLGLRADSIEIHVDAEGAQKTATRAAGGLMDQGTVYLSPGHYDPKTRQGKYLLAHEVAHAAQRSPGRWSRTSPVRKWQAEAEAHQAGEAFAAGNVLPRLRVTLPAWFTARDADATDNVAAKEKELQEFVAAAHQGELAEIHDLLSYGLFDWAITDGDVRRVLTILQLFNFIEERSLVLALNEKDRRRLHDNLDTPHYKSYRTQVLAVYWGSQPAELQKHEQDVLKGLNTMDLKGLEPLEAVAANYTVESLSSAGRNSLLSGRRAEIIREIQAFATDPGTEKIRNDATVKQLDEALKEERTREAERKEAEKTFTSGENAGELQKLVAEIKATLSKFIVRDADALGVLRRLVLYKRRPAELRAIVEHLRVPEDRPEDKRKDYTAYEERDYLDKLISEIPAEALYTEGDERKVFLQILMLRPGYKNEALAEKFANNGIWMDSEDAYLAFLLVKALPARARQAFFAANGGDNWASIEKKLSLQQRESETLNLYTGGEDDRDRNSIQIQLLDDAIWQDQNAGRLDALIRMAVAAGEHRWVWDQSRQRKAYLDQRLVPLVEKYGLFNPNARDAKGRKRDRYYPEVLEGTSWYETGLSGLFYHYVIHGLTLFQIRSRDVQLSTPGLGGEGLNLVEFQKIFGGSFMGVRFQDFSKLGEAGLKAQANKQGVNFADARWDTSAGVMTVQAPRLELAALNYPYEDMKVQAGGGFITNLNLVINYAVPGKPIPTKLGLDAGELELRDVVLIKTDKMQAANAFNVSDLRLRSAPAGTDFSQLEGPLVEGREPDWLLRLIRIGASASQLSSGLTEPDLPKNISVSVGSLTFRGVTTSGGAYIDSIKLHDLLLSTGGDPATYREGLDLSLRRLQVRLKQATAAAAAPGTQDEIDQRKATVRRIERQIGHVREEREQVQKVETEINALEQRGDRLTPAERVTLRTLKAQYTGAVLDVRRVSVKGIAGVQKGEFELADVHGQGRSPTVPLSLLTDPTTLRDLLVGEEGRKVIKGYPEDQLAFTLDIGEVHLPGLTLRGDIPTAEKAQADYNKFKDKYEPWRPSHVAELERLEKRKDLAAQYEQLLRSPGISDFSPQQEKEFRELKRQLEELEAKAETTVGRISAEGLSIGLTGSGRVTGTADRLRVEDIRRGSVRIGSVAAEGDKGEPLRIEVDITGELDPLLDQIDATHLLGKLRELKGSVAVTGLTDQESGLTIDRAELQGVDYASTLTGTTRSRRLKAQLIMVKGATLARTEDLLVRERDYLEKLGSARTPDQEIRLTTIRGELGVLETLRKRVADAEVAKAKARSKQQQAAAETTRQRAQADLDNWGKEVVAGSLAASGIDIGVETTGGDLLHGTLGLSWHVDEIDLDAIRWEGGGRRIFSHGRSAILDSNITASYDGQKKQIIVKELRVRALVADELGYEDDATGLSVVVESGGLAGLLVQGLVLEPPPAGQGAGGPAAQPAAPAGQPAAGSQAASPARKGDELQITSGEFGVEKVNDLKLNVLKSGLRARGTLSGSGLSATFATDGKRIYKIDDLSLRAGEISKAGTGDRIHVAFRKLRGQLTEETTPAGETRYMLDNLALGSLVVGNSRWSDGNKTLSITGPAALGNLRASASVLVGSEKEGRGLKELKIRRLTVDRIEASGSITLSLRAVAPDPRKTGDKGSSAKEISLEHGTIVGLEVTGVDLLADLGKSTGKVEIKNSLDLKQLKVLIGDKGKETLRSTISISALGQGATGGVAGRELSATLLGPKGFRLNLGTINSLAGEVNAGLGDDKSVSFGFATAEKTGRVTMGPIDISADGSRIGLSELEIKDIGLKSLAYDDKKGLSFKLGALQAKTVRLQGLQAQFGELTDRDGQQSQVLKKLGVQGLTFDNIDAKAFEYIGKTTVPGKETTTTTVRADSAQFLDFELKSLDADFAKRITSFDANLKQATVKNFVTTIANAAGEKTTDIFAGELQAGDAHANLTLSGTKIGEQDATTSDGFFELGRLGLTNGFFVTGEKGKETRFEAGEKGATSPLGIELTGLKVKFAPNGTLLAHFDDLIGRKLKFTAEGVTASLDLAELEKANVALQEQPAGKGFELLAANLDRLRLQTLQVDYDVPVPATGSKGKAPAGTWTLEPLDRLSGRLELHLSGVPTINKLDVPVPIQNGTIDFFGVEGMRGYGALEVHFGIDSRGIYHDATIGVDLPAKPRQYDYLDSNIRGSTKEEYTFVPRTVGEGEHQTIVYDMVYTSRGTLKLRPMLEDILNGKSTGSVPSSGGGGSGSGPTAALETKTPIQLGGGELSLGNDKVVLPAVPVPGTNQVILKSAKLGEDLTIDLPRFEATRIGFEAGGKKGETGQVELNQVHVEIRPPGKAKPAVKFTITLGIVDGKVKNIQYGNVSLIIDESKLRKLPPATK